MMSDYSTTMSPSTTLSMAEGNEVVVDIADKSQLPSGALVDSEENLHELMNLVEIAAKSFSTYPQEKVDEIFKHCAAVANLHRVTLAKMAVDEAGMGLLEDKTIKNHYAAEAVYSAYKDTKTCGIISEVEGGGYAVYAEPIGILAGIIPCTNPTSTVIFKALLALKSRNCIVFSPHPRTAKCSIAAAKIILKAAVSAGAPANCIGWIDVASVQLCKVLMMHKATDMIVATGATALVKAAYSSGKPCQGGGSGNTPVVVDETADVNAVVSSVLLSKTFDHGMICASEQAVVAVKEIAQKLKDEFTSRGAYFLKNEDEKKRLGSVLIGDNGMLNPAAVGQSASRLAELAGLKVPDNCPVLVAEISNVGLNEKLSHEKLCPCLGFYVEDDYDLALNRALELVKFGGLGHTSVLYTDMNGLHMKSRVKQFEDIMPTGRALVCMPSSQGAIGGIFNSEQTPSLSLGCGSWGGNASAEGLQVKHLLNLKQVAIRQEPLRTFLAPPVITGKNVAATAIKDLKSVRRACILASEVVALQNGESITSICAGLESMGIERVVLHVPNGPIDMNTCSNAFRRLKVDAIIAVGSQKVLDYAKLMRFLCEHPEADIDKLSSRYITPSTRVSQFPERTNVIKKLICFQTIESCGAEMVPCLSLTITQNHENRPMYLSDSSLMPDMVVVDYNFYDTEVKKSDLGSFLIATMARAIESYTSLMASDLSRGMSLQALRLCMTDNHHRAATLAAMAMANAPPGILLSLSRQLTTHFEIPPSVAQSVLICSIIKFNRDEAPTKMGTVFRYERPKSMEIYKEIEAALQFKSPLEIYLQNLKKSHSVPNGIKDFGISEKEFMNKLDDLAMGAFDDQNTSTNPRYPLIKELKQILIEAYFGNV